MMNCERPYYRDSNCRPFLCYVMFGVKNEELRVSRGFKKGRMKRLQRGRKWISENYR